MDVDVELHCSSCGSANFTLAPGGAEAPISCNDCGAGLGTAAELDAQLRQRAEALLRRR